MERIKITSNLQDVGHLTLSIVVPITVNNDVDTLIKCLTNTMFIQNGGELYIDKNLGGTPSRLLCIKKKQDECFSVYEYPYDIMLIREFIKIKRKNTNTFGVIASDSIINLKETISIINGLINQGEILYE